MSKRILIYEPLFVLAIVSGIITGCLGQPYDPTVFALHKIISVGAVVLSIVLIRRQVKEKGITPALRVSIIILLISALVLFASGALMSVGVSYGIIRPVHAFAPIPAAFMMVLINISFRRKQQEKTPLPGA